MVNKVNNIRGKESGHIQCLCSAHVLTHSYDSIFLMHTLFTVPATPDFSDRLDKSIDVTILLLQHSRGWFTVLITCRESVSINSMVKMNRWGFNNIWAKT